MKQVYLLLSLCLLSFQTIFAQNGVPQYAGSRGAAMGNTGLTFKDINSAFVNQAGLAYLNTPSFTVFAERRFLMTEGLNSFMFAGAYPNKKFGTFGLTIQHFGFQDYNEQKIGLAYARRLFKRMSLGVQLDYLSTRIPNYGVAHNFTFEIGLMAEISKQVHLAAQVFSPARIKLPNEDVIPSTFRLGLAYLPSKKVRMNVEIEKDLINPLVGKFGIEYRPLEVIAFRAGLSTNPLLSSFGLGLYLKNFQIDIATNYHSALGFSPNVALTYTIGKKEESKKK